VGDGKLELELEYASGRQAALRAVTVTNSNLLTNPGGLMKVPLGDDFVLVDQICWQQPVAAVAIKAKRLASLLAMNMRPLRNLIVSSIGWFRLANGIKRANVSASD